MPRISDGTPFLKTLRSRAIPALGTTGELGPPRGLNGLTAFFSSALPTLLVFLAGAQVAWATSDNDAVDLCNEDLLTNYGAESVQTDEVRRHDQVPFVYGTTDFADVKGVHFRCRVYNDKVTSMRYLVVDTENMVGTGWAIARPHETAPVELELDENAKAAPPTGTFEPHFEAVPSPSN